MLTGAEIWNEARIGTPDEWAAVAALGSKVVKLRPYPVNAQYWPTWLCNTAKGYLGDPLLLLRRHADGLIDPSGQVEEIRPWIAAAKQYRLRVVYILDNEPNHPASPYRTLGLGRYRRDLGELILALEREYPGLPLASPPMALWHDDLAWLEALAGDFYMWGLEYHCAHLYWQGDNYTSPDWGRRIEQYSAICPGVRWLADEVGDASPINEKGARERADSCLSVLRYLQARRDVEAAAIFLPISGTPEWSRYQLPVEELERIRSGLNEEASMATVTIGNGYQVRDRRQELPTTGVYARRDLALVKGIAIHHSGVDEAPDSDHALAAANYHVNTLGWPGVGYHICINPNGTAELLNDLDRASYHVAGRNAELIGVELPGDFTNHHPTVAQLAACRRVVAELQYMLGWFAPAKGHRDWALPAYPSACPGATQDQWIPSVQVEQPDIQEPEQWPRYVLGFADLAANLGPDVVGKPLEDERRVSFIIQETERGLMVYEDGKAPSFYERLV